MTFVSGYRMVFNLFKIEQNYNSILCNTMVLSSTIIIVTRYKKLYLKTAFNFNISNISHQGYFPDKQMIEYGQEMPQSQPADQPDMAL